MEADASRPDSQAFREEAAVRAAARALHDSVREKRQFTWEKASPAWRAGMEAFVRPLIVAGLAAADELVKAVERHLKPIQRNS